VSATWLAVDFVITPVRRELDGNDVVMAFWVVRAQRR
jgi:hypothetical protein